MFRRSLVLALLLLPFWVESAAAQQSQRLDVGTLKAALRTASPEDNGFIETVVTMADNGDLPRSVINSTFRWALTKPIKRRFQYFKRGLIVRAARMGINIPT